MNGAERNRKYRQKSRAKYKATKDAWRAKNKDKIAAQVKAYAEKHREHLSALKAAQYKERKEFVWNYKLNHPCMVCGECDPIVLEFDHLDPSIKEATVANMLGRSGSIEKISKEIAKCQVLCANCHRRKHYYEKTNH